MEVGHATGNVHALLRTSSTPNLDAGIFHCTARAHLLLCWRFPNEPSVLATATTQQHHLRALEDEAKPHTKQLLHGVELLQQLHCG